MVTAGGILDNPAELAFIEEAVFASSLGTFTDGGSAIPPCPGASRDLN